MPGINQCYLTYDFPKLLRLSLIVIPDPSLPLEAVVVEKTQFWCWSGIYFPFNTLDDSSKPAWWRNIVPGVPNVDHWKYIRDDITTRDINVKANNGGYSIQMWVQGSDPQVLFAPDLKSRTYIQVNQNIGEPPTVQVLGLTYHTKFPGFELYANGQKLDASNPVITGSTPLDLIGDIYDDENYITRYDQVYLTPQATVNADASFKIPSTPPSINTHCDADPSTANPPIAPDP